VKQERLYLISTVGFLVGVVCFATILLSYKARSAAGKEIAQAIEDASATARGDMRVSVIDECTDVHRKADHYRDRGVDAETAYRYTDLCQAALRRALRFYSDLGGDHGCAQVKRVLATYPTMDEVSEQAVVKCARK